MQHFKTTLPCYCGKSAKIDGEAFHVLDFKNRFQSNPKMFLLEIVFKFWAVLLDFFVQDNPVPNSFAAVNAFFLKCTALWIAKFFYQQSFKIIYLFNLHNVHF